MRALVTGGAGFIGSALVDRLLAEGHEVDVVDDLSTGSLSNLAEARAAGGKALRIHQLDIRVPEMVELVARRRPSVVFHLAAQSSVPVSVARPMFDAEVNVLGTLNVLEGARAAAADRVVYAASGGTLYGEPDVSKLPIPETLAHRPLSPYGVSKKSAIDYMVAYREMHAVEFTALALANVYGPRQDPHGESGVVAIFAQHLMANETVSIFGDGEQTRDFVYVDDVVDAFVRASARGGGLICNVGTGKGTSVNEIYRILAEAAGVDTPPERPPMPPARAGDVRHSSLDPARAAMQLGWQAWTTVETGLAATLRFFAERSGSGSSG
jgi:UDP-glucose 4-epimerase